MINDDDLIPDLMFQNAPNEKDIFGDNGFGVESDYDALHTLFPFLPINPPIGAVNAVKIVTANVAKDLPVPTGAQLVRFTSTAEFYVAGQNAVKPAADLFDGSAPILYPEGWYYCRGVQSYSVVSPTANAIISAEFFISL